MTVQVEDPAGPKSPGETADSEGTMGYLLFLAIAFVLVGVDRLAHLGRDYAARHGHTPRS